MSDLLGAKNMVAEAKFKYANWLLFQESLTGDPDMDKSLIKAIESFIDHDDQFAIDVYDIVKGLEVFLDENFNIKMVAGYLAKANLEMEARDE